MSLRFSEGQVYHMVAEVVAMVYIVEIGNCLHRVKGKVWTMEIHSKPVNEDNLLHPVGLALILLQLTQPNITTFHVGNTPCSTLVAPQGGQEFGSRVCETIKHLSTIS